MGMALLSETEQDWIERAKLTNYRCRDCRELIGFADQELYFSQGLCTPCKNIRDEERRGLPDPRKRVQEMPSPEPAAESDTSQAV